MFKKLLSAVAILYVALPGFTQASKSLIYGSGNGLGTNGFWLFNQSTGCGSGNVPTDDVPAGNDNPAVGMAWSGVTNEFFMAKSDPVLSSDAVLIKYNPTSSSFTTFPGGVNSIAVQDAVLVRLCSGPDGYLYATRSIASSDGGTAQIDGNNYSMKNLALIRVNPVTGTYVQIGFLTNPLSNQFPSPWGTSANSARNWTTSGQNPFSSSLNYQGNGGNGDMTIVANPAGGYTCYIMCGNWLFSTPFSPSTGFGVSGGNITPFTRASNITWANNQNPFIGTFGLAYDNTAGTIYGVGGTNNPSATANIFTTNPATGTRGANITSSGCPMTNAQYNDATEAFNSIAVAQSLTSATYIRARKYRLTYKIYIKNIGNVNIRNFQVAENLAARFPSCTFSNFSLTSVGSSGLGLNTASFNGVGNTSLITATQTFRDSLYNTSFPAATSYNQARDTITLAFDIDNVREDGTVYNNFVTASGTTLDGATISDLSDNGTNADPNSDANGDDAGEGDPTPVKFGTTVAGTIWNDINGSANNTYSGIQNGGEVGIVLPANTLYAVVVDNTTGLSISSALVNTSGAYSLDSVPGFAPASNAAGTTGFSIRLTTGAAIPGSAPPPVVTNAQLQALGIVVTSLATKIKGADASAGSSVPGTGTFDPTNANTNFGATAVTSQDFGMERTPETALNLQASQANPGGFNFVTVPAGAFFTNNNGGVANTTDYDGGTVTSITVNSFPGNTNAFRVGAVTYTNGGTCPVATTCTAWPGTLSIPYTNGTG
ncbi:MAG: hypothetical protein V4722_27835, partial [Bacteroidota bacterium]